MARPCRWRRICTVPEFDRFVPEGIPSPGSITLTVDEYEAVRLIDLMKCTHEQCAAQLYERHHGNDKNGRLAPRAEQPVK